MTTDASTIDALFDALADGQRRELLASLRGASEASVEELVSAVGRQADGLERACDDLAVRLHHVHLLRLADAGPVEYDRSVGRVEYVGGSAIGDLLVTVSPRTVTE